MICILHGYLLEGSGSNLWTRSIIESLCRSGQNVHLMAQENHPERYRFIRESRRYGADGSKETFHRQESPYRGSCVLHKPLLGDTLPVYVRDTYEEFARVVPMVELTDEELDQYIERNVAALTRVVEENGITALHANHTVIMPVIAQVVSERTGVPYAVMPHGSALEYAVKKDPRYLRLAEDAFSRASTIFVHGTEMRSRVRDSLPNVAGMEEKFSDLHLGVDTNQFVPIPRVARAANVTQLKQSLVALPRGRTPEQTDALLESLSPQLTEAELTARMEAARRFDTRAPDAGLERKLAAVDWEHDPTLLFVGRLISTKGIHGVLAALPLLLEARPSLRLLVVGHGPLREPLEAMLWALEHGARALFEMIVARGRVLEGSPEGEAESTALTQARSFLDALRSRGQLDDYFSLAQRVVRRENVIFTGYLTHRELRFLFPCCDASIFPSVVKEAGPLVFLEALASGSYPLGTYFGGMKVSIDSVASALPEGAARPMRLDADPARTVQDMVRNVPLALEMGEKHKEALFQIARDHYDWSSVAMKLSRELEAM